MSKLPFVVQPKLQPKIELIGSDESGKIKIERRGYLSSGEKAFMTQAKSTDEATAILVNLSRRIAARYKIDMMAAYELVTGAISGTSDDPRLLEIETEYQEELSRTITALTATQTRDKLLQATCLMIYRYEAEWTVSDTMQMHPDIVDGLAALYEDEENKSIEALDPKLKTEVTVEELEKKPSKK